jgi:acetyl esterase/lipase
MNDIMQSASNALKNTVADKCKKMGPEYVFAARVRKLFGTNDKVRDEGLTEPENIVKIKDLAYGNDPEQVLDLYYPSGTGSALPAIVSVHGGGYVYGDKDLYRFYCMSLAQRGFAVVNFSYRLAPGYRFPAQLNDVNAVMQFARSHAEEYFIDPHNIFFVGDSAGAQMASQYLAAVTNPAYASLLGLEIPKFDVRACALNCGFYIPDPHQDRMLMKCYLEDPSQVKTEEMDVIAHITSAFPPAFVMTSNGDFLRKRAMPFVDVLTAKGVEAEYHDYCPDDRELGHVFHCNMKEPYAKICNDEECAFFAAHVE